MAKELVKVWGDRALTVIKLEDCISTAAEKAPTDDAQIASLCEAISRVKNDYDVVVKQEEERVREAAGLHVIIGTECHESRRVYNQLRGRTGRQGDLCSTCFFLSLGYSLLRIFGSEKLLA